MTAEDKIAELSTRFLGLEDELDRLNLLLSYAAILSEPSEELRQPENLVKGCQSKVWLKRRIEDGKVRLALYSDTRLVRGVLSLITEIFQGREAAELRDYRGDLLEKLGLSELFPMTRRNGLHAVLEQLVSDL